MLLKKDARSIGFATCDRLKLFNSMATFKQDGLRMLVAKHPQNPYFGVIAPFSSARNEPTVAPPSEPFFSQSIDALCSTRRCVSSVHEMRSACDAEKDFLARSEIVEQFEI